MVIPVLTLAFAAGCVAPETGTLSGTVTVGPMCPAQRESPDPDCDDSPLSITLQALRGGRVVATFTSDGQGHYNVMLPAGTYTLRDQAQSLPSCHAGPADIVAGQQRRLDIQCDSGIR